MFLSGDYRDPKYYHSGINYCNLNSNYNYRLRTQRKLGNNHHVKPIQPIHYYSDKYRRTYSLR